MSNYKYPYGIENVEDNKITFTKEYLEYYLNICESTAKRAKEQDDEESFSYFMGRAGVFKALLEYFNK